MRIAEAHTDDDILRCFEVMQQLRPHLSRDEFLPRVRGMQQEGFRVAFVEDGGDVCAVAGYRFFDLLFSGRTLYVDDLVTDERRRSQGHGAALHEWLQAEAHAAGCSTLTLDSGVQRAGAHRFYFRQRMTIQGYHFIMPLHDGEG